MTEEISVFISADMEGVAAVVDRKEVKKGNSEYDKACELMTEEVNAAVEGAREAGADKILVKDAHASARNIIPGKLHSEAELFRGWSGRPGGMIDGLNEDFDLAVFTGYHAGAGSDDVVLSHNFSGRFSRITINNNMMNEAIFNALYAGYHGVPIGFISGDEKACQQTRNHIKDIETAVIKYGSGEGVVSLSPLKARKKIKAGVEKAVEKYDEFTPLEFNSPYNLVANFTKRKYAIEAGNYPGASKVDIKKVKFSCDDVEELMTFIHFVK